MNAGKIVFFVVVAIGFTLSLYFGIAVLCASVTVPALIDMAMKHRLALLLSPTFIVFGVVLLIIWRRPRQARPVGQADIHEKP